MASKISALLIAFLFCTISVYTLQAQCETWNDSPRKEEAENAHSNYRSALKMGDFGLAYTEWETAYDIAPAADGGRDFHYTDGIKIFKEQLKDPANASKKAELTSNILQLYDQAASCYENKSITLKNCEGDCYTHKAGQLLGRKGFDMFYEFNSPYEENLAALTTSLEKTGNDVEYIIFEPMANIIVYQFQNEKMDAETVRGLHEKLVTAADYNIEKAGQYKAYFESSKARMLAKFAEIESDVFDCDYFKSKLEPMYNEKPDDPDVVKYVYNKLLQEGCDKSDGFLQRLEGIYLEYAKEENAKMQAEFEANNPGVVANKLYKEGDFEGAILKYEEALQTEEDQDKRAQYYFNIASIQFRKQGKLQEARTNAVKAAELRSAWGQPFLLVGDIYAKAAKACGGDAWGQRVVILAALDKFGYAKSIDGTVADEANRKIGIYNAHKPTKDDAFMRGHKPGESLSTGCWIGERTKLRVQ